MLTAADGGPSDRFGLPAAASKVRSHLLLALLGLPLRIELREVRHRDGVSSACHGWDGRPERGVAPLRLDLECDPSLLGTGATEVTVNGMQLALTGKGARGSACADLGEAWCAASSAYLAAPERLRADVLEPLVLFLATRRGRVPLHAAAIKRGDLAILLMGPSGAGKSSLALAADRAGWTVLAEDTVYLQREPAFRVRGCPGPAHLLPGDLRGRTTHVRLRNGKLKHAVELRHRHPDGLVASRATVCLLARGERVALERVGRSEALEQMSRLEPGFALLADDIRATNELLVRDGAWRLTLSAKPAEAIEFLSSNMACLEEIAASPPSTPG